MTAPQDPFAANVARSAANLSEAQRRIEAAAMTDHALEAAAQAEERFHSTIGEAIEM